MVRPRTIVAYLAVLLGALVVAFALAPSADRDPAAPARVDRGLIDLRDHDFERWPVLSLEGEWTGCARRLVDPLEYAAGRRPACDRTLPVPGNWRQRRLADEAGEGGRGDAAAGGAQHLATLHLRLLLPAGSEPLALRLVGFFPANRVWVGDRLAAQTGRVATHAGGEVADPALQIVALPGGADTVELVIQASNFSQILLGAMRVEIGRADLIDAQQTRHWALAMASVGVLLLMGFYHLALYFFRRSEAGPLYLGLNCLLWIGTVLCMGASDWVIRVFLPDAPGEVLYRIWPFCLFLASAFAYQFYRALYPLEFPRWIAHALWLVSLACAAIALAAPLRVLAVVLLGYYVITVARLAFSAWALAQAARHRRPGAAIILCGYLLMLALTINDLLNGLGVIRSLVTVHLGMIVYMFSQSLALAQRFSTLFSSVEALSFDLAHQKQSLEQEVAERIRLQHEVVTVSEEERRRISHELHDGLCQQLTAARLQCAGLASRRPEADRGERELARLSDLLDESVDQAYDLSRGLWPIKLDADDVGVALSTLARRQSETSGTLVEFESRNLCVGCSDVHAAQIYGIAREAIANALKHAKASRVTVTLDCSGAQRALLSIVDDGIGRHASKSNKDGLGLRIMVYRAQMVGGDFRIQSPASGGTCVSCSFPCKAPLPTPG